MTLKTRNYRFKGINPGKEQRRFWILILLTIAVCIAITYLF
ncbi:MAG: hypothetical protein JWQ25_1908 [Daejeonella sp.]|nr:hypothetical protein [Daejeonella sp.]